MKVSFDALANHSLFHAEKNNKAAVSSLNKITSGLKINSAGDNASTFAISEQMRTKIRTLDQSSSNVQSGNRILNTANDGITQQINILQTIRARVINAASDHNTDEDRKTIQKEINHLYEQMDNIAYTTQYNSMQPLLANSKILSEESLAIDRTALNLIPDEYEMLDNIQGPFDIFSEYSSTKATLGTTSGYSSGTSKVMSMDFSGYSNISQLNEVGVRIGSYTYVFTDDTSKNYRNAYKISINDSMSVSDAINALKNRFSGASIDGTKLNISTSSISGASDPGGTYTSTGRVSHTGTGAGISGTTSGGVTNLSGDTDLPAAAPATLTVNLSGVTSNTGFRFDGYNFRVLNSGETGEGTVDRTLYKGQSSNSSTSNFSYTFDGTNLTFTARTNGTTYNGRSITDGYTYYTNDGPTTTTDYTAYSAFTGAVATVSDGTSSTLASWSLDLSSKTVEDFSAEYAGKTLQFGSYYYKFYDSAIAPKLEGLTEDSGSRNDTLNRRPIDINTIRQSVESGSTLAQAVASKLGRTADGDSVKFTSSYNGAQINLITENLRHYDIDFSGLDVNYPNSLYGKGFRAYCATDNREWFNFVFTDGTNNFTTDRTNIKSININVSGVTNANELVQAIYNQGNAALTAPAPDPNNHHMRVAADFDNNIITLYDHRRFDVSQAPYAYQELGAKIADGFLLEDFFDANDRDYWIKDLVIQDTDTADMNLRLKIPQMTLDQIFNPLPDASKTIYDYSVVDKESRDALLGTSSRAGILDIGLKYLLESAASVGAQSKRLEYVAENISTETTNLTATESVLRDADMAKEMTAYVKHRILTQASQTMLAQTNQLRTMVISLLTDKEETA